MSRFLPLLLFFACPIQAQSLYLSTGENAVEAGGGWSVGPQSTGIETAVAAGLGGRFDVGMAVSRYTYTFDDGFESTFTEYAPFVRYYPVKEQSGAPVSVAVSAQVFLDDYGNEDEGRYVQIGTTAFKQLRLSRAFALQPFAGFGFVAESYTFGDSPAETARYLTRDFGLHFTTAVERAWVLRFTLIEQSFRRETYRGARAAVIRRL